MGTKKSKTAWNKPTINYFGSIEDITLRIENLQKLIIFYNNKGDSESLEIASGYKEELTRLQTRYQTILKSKIYA